jgi:dTDP-4-amino-4,6-dideoxygalactose transaminase
MSSLEEIWAGDQLTNSGAFTSGWKGARRVQGSGISLVANGTLALIAAIRALGVSGEVVTTPFSFVATATLLWNGITPVFADIARRASTSADAVEAAITPRTTAILPVHVYGRPRPDRVAAHSRSTRTQGHLRRCARNGRAWPRL